VHLNVIYYRNYSFAKILLEKKTRFHDIKFYIMKTTVIMYKNTIILLKLVTVKSGKRK